MIKETVQSLSPGNKVQLFQVAYSGKPTLYFTKRGASGTGEVKFDGITYTQIDLEADGFKWDGQGTFPQPKLSVSNVSGLLTPLLVQNEYYVGAVVTVITTFEKYLDGASEADPTQTFPIEIYTIEQPTDINHAFSEWRLSSIIDQTGSKLPGRVMLRDVCNLKYRRLVNGVLTNFPGECPYNGVSYYNENDVATTAANDKCSHRESGCSLRYGAKKKKPFGAFPGISRRNG